MRISVLIIGKLDPSYIQSIHWKPIKSCEESKFDISHLPDDRGIMVHLALKRPHVIVSFGGSAYPNLSDMPLQWRARWIHFSDAPEPETVGQRVMNVYINNIAAPRFPALPLVSVFTPTYNTGAGICRPLASLQNQKYPNWEWVIYDDSEDRGATYELIRRATMTDPRVRLFRGSHNSGRIGEVKRRACGLCSGKILVELDHDDELTDHCIGDLVEAYNKFPDSGFYYTDCAEKYEDGRDRVYGDGWGFHFGSYRQEAYGGKTYQVSNYPDLNAKTIRHIVGVPNHVRAWKVETYHAIGGHCPDLHVADDYELLVRTFLSTRMVHIRRFGYIQYFGNNTHQRRLAEIQRLVRWISWKYEDRIHQRLKELGVDDFIRPDDKPCDWMIPNPAPTPIANYELK